MSFVIQRVGRGRKYSVRLFPRSTDPSVCVNIPKNGASLAGILGVSGQPAWFRSNVDTNNGYFGTGVDGTKYVTESGLFSGGEYAQLTDLSRTETDGNIYSNMSLNDGESFVIVAYLKVVQSAGNNGSIAIRTMGAGYPYIQCYPYGLTGTFLSYCVTELGGGPAASGNNFSKCGSVAVAMFGWNSANSKVWSVTGGALSETTSTVTSNWSVASFFKLWKIAECGGLVELALFRGSAADTLRANALTANAALLSSLNCNGKLLASTSAVLHESSATIHDVSRANNPYANANGLIIHNPVTNLFANTYGMADWTLTNLPKVDWKSIASDGMRTLTSVKETTVDGEHKAVISITPAATGVHWFEFTCRMSSISAIAISIDNGTDSTLLSFDPAGNQTSYNDVNTDATITTLSFRLFCVKLPITLTVTDACVITARAMVQDAEETWLDSYAGVATREMFLGQWAFTEGERPLLAIPVSIGTSATAISPIVDLVDPKVLQRLKNGRMTASVQIKMESWPGADVCLWTWRKDATHGIEVWLRYKSLTDSRRMFAPCVNVFDGGAGVETQLIGDNHWALINISTGVCVETLRMSMAINSSGVAHWFARSEAGQEITWYEIEDNFQTSGDTQISSYVAPVPTSIRLGSAIDGTGQQKMQISEVSAW